jgi:DNA-directed RNA polymerase subunit RPC12/RpoP
MSDTPSAAPGSAAAPVVTESAPKFTKDGVEIIPIELLGLANDEESGVYDKVEIEDMEFDEEQEAYFYPCPCGDKFYITLKDLKNGEDIATCPSCSLRISVIYDPEDFVEYEEDDA